MARPWLKSALLWIAVVVAFSACFYDFADFEIVGGGEGDGDGDVDGDTDTDVDSDTDVDADGDIGDNPIDRGVACDNPHLLVALSAGQSSGLSRLLRFNLSTTVPPSLCRETPVMTDQPAWGSNLYSVIGLHDGAEVIAVSRSIIMLDDEGFPRWRWQRWDDADFGILRLFPVYLPTGEHIAALHCHIQCHYEDYGGPIILDRNGNEVTYINSEGVSSWDLVAGAPYPDNSQSKIILADTGYPPLVFDVDESTTALDDSEGVVLADGLDLDGHGTLQDFISDPPTRRVIAVYRDGVVMWRLGEPVSLTPTTCAECEHYHAVAIDPNGEDSAYVVCTYFDERKPSLVRMSEFGCDRVIDPSVYGNHYVEDVTLVRGAI